MGRLAHLAESCAGGEWYRSASSENSRPIIKKDFIGDSRRQGGPINQRTTFNHNAGYLAFGQAVADCFQIGTAVSTRGRDLFDLNTMIDQLLLFLLFCERTKN